MTMRTNLLALNASMLSVHRASLMGATLYKLTVYEWKGILRLFQYKLRFLVPLFAAVLLAGCVGGGESGVGLEEINANNGSLNTNATTSATVTTPSPNDTPGGIWRGSVTTGAGTFASIGLVNEAGDLRFITPGSDQTSGTFTVSGNLFTANLRSYVPFGFFTFTPPVHGSATGSINKRSALSGTISLHDSATSTFSFNYDSLYERDSSLSAISGNYSKSDGAGYTVTYSIDAAGVFTGSDTRGCMVNGNVEILDKDFNMYKASVIVTNCGETNGHYSGLAALADGVSQNDTLLFSMECVEDLIAGSITRA